MLKLKEWDKLDWLRGWAALEVIEVLKKLS